MNGQLPVLGFAVQSQWFHPVLVQQLGVALSHITHLLENAGFLSLSSPNQHDGRRGPLHRSHFEVDAFIGAPVLHLPPHMAQQQHLLLAVLNGTVHNALSNILQAHGCCCQVVVDTSIVAPVLHVPRHMAGLSGILVHATDEALHLVPLVQRLVHGGLTPIPVMQFPLAGQPMGDHTGTLFYPLTQMSHGSGMWGGIGAPADGAPPKRPSQEVAGPSPTAAHNGAPLIGYALTPVYDCAAAQGQGQNQAVEPPHDQHHANKHHHAKAGGRLGSVVGDGAEAAGHPADATDFGQGGPEVGGGAPRKSGHKTGHGDASRDAAGAGHATNGHAGNAKGAHGHGRNGTRASVKGQKTL